MTIGNRPKEGELGVPRRVYWWLSIGRNVPPYRVWEGGWRGVEFVVMKPYEDYTLDEKKRGTAHPCLIKIGFAFWLPFFTF